MQTLCHPEETHRVILSEFESQWAVEIVILCCTHFIVSMTAEVRGS